ncbi:hypothetical protein DMH04_31310 [Kibdelosporangium aridum]|uniref:DUF4380 domain-containing protein n=1 Tax=Kibdelosporangium aridum TaxID=2030 RepID=A0A428Z2D6_KIBAR|nr:DUF6786 family protein [Kibdelosporangium aridum]RSM79473.1 hypothetical protein DMH04_31310 [Kibdelosporangium aridum]
MIWTWAGGWLEVAAGRVMQVSVGGHEAFWQATRPEGWNVGGDRLWLGPERDWFWATDDPHDLDGHIVPEAIDPGKWHTVRDELGHAEFTANPVLHHRRNGTTTQVAITRHIHLRYADSERVAYEVQTELTMGYAPAGQELSAWSVLQVPTGGLLEIDLAGPWAFRDYLKPVDPARFTVGDFRTKIRLTATTMGKIGVQPDVFAGWLRYTTDELTIERAVEVQPQSRYCDHPLGADPAGQGDALQVFEDDGHYGGYAELEHHSPAIRANGPKTVVDVCRTAVTVRHRP